MSGDSYKFPDSEDSSSRLVSSNDNRRIDDALLHALSLVLSSNSEYARSVSALLENDLSKEQDIDKLNSTTKELLENTQTLIQSQEQLKKILEDMSEEYKEFLEAVIKSYLGTQQEYMDKKFKALFENAGLKDDGSEYGPTDKLIVKIKNVFSNEIWAMVIGAIIYHFIIILIAHFKGSK